MPKLPDATNLSGVNIGAPRSMVDIPVPDYAGAANVVARGVSDLGTGVTTVIDERRKRFAAQERFDTKMGLIKAEEAYAERVRDLDPLDPDYVEKKKAARRETFAPVLSNVKDPENRQRFEEETLIDYTNIGIKAGDEQRGAFGKKAEIEISDYADGIRRKIRSGEYKGDAAEELRETIEDNQYLTRQEKDTLFRELGKGIDSDLIEVEYENITGKGVSVTREVQAAISAVENTEGVPSWLGSYLARLATVESGGGRNMYNSENPGVVGVWQFTEGTARQVGLNPKDRIDVAKSTAAVVKLTAQNASVLREALGREPTPGELYLAHQQGAGGAVKILSNPNARAVDVLGKKQVELNLPKSMRGQTENITAGQFAQLWTGKFERTGGRIDETEVLTIVEQSPAYLRMTPDEQDKVKANILTRTEKLNKEAEKSAKIELSRSSVDFAVANFEDRDEAADYIKKNISDPDTREDALAMLNTEYNRIDENLRIEEKKRFDEVYDAVVAAVDGGDTTAALAAIPADLPGDEKVKLRKLITDGRAASDDPDTYNEILAMKLGTPEERAKFADLDLRPYIGKLKPSTIEALSNDQEALKKKIADTGKAPSFDTAAAVLDQRMRELGIDTTSKASPEDLRTARAIKRIMAENTQAAVDRAGRDLTPLEVEKIMDETFMQFRGKVPGWFTTSDETFELSDVVNKYAVEEERLGMSPGSLINEAIADFQEADPTFIVTGEALNEWLKRKIDGAAQ